MPPKKIDRTALQEAIGIVGVGKKGSRHLPDDLIEKVIYDLENHLSPAICEGAFFAALLYKGVAGGEGKIFSARGEWNSWQEFHKNDRSYVVSFLRNYLKLSDFFSEDGANAAVHLVSSDHRLEREQAKLLGDFLFSASPGESSDVDEFLRGFIVSWLRIRYESAEEWQGLYDAARSTVNILPDSFLEGAMGAMEHFQNHHIVVLAEPFNGFTYTPFLSLLLGEELSKNGFLVFFLLGENSGPKFNANLYDIVTELKLPFLPKVDQHLVGEYRTRFGFFIDQKNTSGAVANWVFRRRKIIKRPFLATIEKYLLPFSDRWQSKITLLTSAFHPPYVEKMISLGEYAKFHAVVVAKMTLEGGLTPSLLRPLKLTISVRDGNSYQRKNCHFPSERRGIEEKKEMQLSDHVGFLKEYMTSGRIANADWEKKWEKMKEIYLPILDQMKS